MATHLSLSFAAIQNAIREWKSKKENKNSGENGNDDDDEDDEEDIYHVDTTTLSDSEDPTEISNLSELSSNPKYIAHVPVPTQLEVEQALLERRKQELMEKYGVRETKNEEI